MNAYPEPRSTLKDIVGLVSTSLDNCSDEATWTDSTYALMRDHVALLHLIKRTAEQLLESF